ncbi:carbohydrate ABC transporter permease [Ignavibacteriales bacterium]
MKKFLLYAFLTITGLLTLALSSGWSPHRLCSTGTLRFFPPRFFPDIFSLTQYETLFSRLDVSRNLLNSLMISTMVTVVSLLFNSMAGFAFAKYRFAGKDAIFKLLLSSMVIPSQVTMLPLFLMLKEFGFLNTYMAILIPGLANVFGIFLIRQYVMAIPDSLLESARIDGATDFQIYYKIIIPLAAPVMVTLAIFTFMGTWNDFLWPLIVLNDSDMYTLPVALANLMGEHTKDPELMMAGSVITILPVMVMFLVLQKYYIKGIMMGGVKE